MVDVSAKPATKRVAKACAVVRMKPETLALIRSNALGKGDTLGVARVAGIMAAKRAHDLIPLCHDIALADAAVEFAFEQDGLSIRVTATAATVAGTGVEMEALTAATIAALTIYDMAKAVDRGMSIEEVRLLEKSGGKSGDYKWTQT